TASCSKFANLTIRRRSCIVNSVLSRAAYVAVTIPTTTKTPSSCAGAGCCAGGGDRQMRCRAIEPSCDEPSVAVVTDGRTLAPTLVASQLALHSRYGGVVPELASRRHLELILPVLEEALAAANVTADDIDLVAVTRGPGLMGALMVGVVAAKTIAYLY